MSGLVMRLGGAEVLTVAPPSALPSVVFTMSTCKGNSVDAKVYCWDGVDVKGNVVDAEGNGVDVKANSVDVKGYL
eukprot:638263-Pyramimonas_sp.AAC.4